MSYLPSSPIFLRPHIGRTNRTQDLHVELNRMRLVAPAQLFADFGIGYSAYFPGAIEMFKPRTRETLFGEIAKDQVSFGQRRILAKSHAFRIAK